MFVGIAYLIDSKLGKWYANKEIICLKVSIFNAFLTGWCSFLM